MKEACRTVLEAMVVAALGCGVGLAANAARSKSGIELARDYYPTLPRKPIDPESDRTNPAPGGGGMSEPADHESTYEELVRQVEAHGFQAVPHDEVVALFQDELYRAGVYLFIDARNDEHYAEGHIPGAYHVNRFWSTSELDQVIQGLAPQIQSALKVVVYCGGGDCTDSIFAAHELINRGVDRGKTYVYAEGMKVWRSAALPVESGQRNSGVITGGSP